jgi:hypothetical protein
MFKLETKNIDYNDLNSNLENIDDYYGGDKSYNDFVSLDIEDRRSINTKLDKNKEKYKNYYLIYIVLLIVLIFTLIYIFLYVMTDISTVKFILYFIGLIFLGYFLQFILNI